MTTTMTTTMTMTTARRRRPGGTKGWRGEGARALWDAYIDDPTIEARNRLVEWYCPLVRHHANRIGGGLWGPVEADDLIGPGAVGLMQAIEAFDPARGVKFETFATARIVGEMRDELRRVDWRGRGVRARIRMVKAGREELTGSLGHDPTDEELGDRLGLGAEEFRRAVDDAGFRVDSLERRVGHTANGDRDVLLHHVLPDGRFGPPDAGVVREDFWELACLALSARDAKILRGYYSEGLTMKEIARRFGINESRISQIHAEVVNYIREYFGDRLIAYNA